ncbi:hypothetical protein EDD15DRAFT_2431018 [Pisolithus albus]|nr:hypothetical protein EDD15DRAFT_2431018 [Pisolithus albus]
MFLAPKLSTSSFTPTTSNKTGKRSQRNAIATSFNSPPSPTLLPGRSQASAGDFPAILKKSGMASMERLTTTHRHSFDGSLRGIPATITPGVADTGIGSGVEEHREQPRVPPPQGVGHLSPIAAMILKPSSNSLPPQVPIVGIKLTKRNFGQPSQKTYAEKPTSKSEPRLVHPMAASDEFHELWIRLRKEREDALPHNVTVDSGPQTWGDHDTTAAQVQQVVVTPPDHSQRRSASILPNAINSVTPPDDTRNVHTSDGEHAGCCIMCGFKWIVPSTAMLYMTTYGTMIFILTSISPTPASVIDALAQDIATGSSVNEFGHTGARKYKFDWDTNILTIPNWYRKLLTVDTGQRWGWQMLVVEKSLNRLERRKKKADIVEAYLVTIRRWWCITVDVVVVVVVVNGAGR